MQLLNLLCQDRVLANYAIDQLIGAEILLADLADIDTLLRCRTNGNELTANVITGSQKLMAFERCYDEDLGTFPAHAESYQLERKGFAGTAGSQKNHIGVFIYAAIEDINYDQAVVMLVDSEQDAVLITHLKRGEGIATGRRGCQHIALAGLEQLLIQLTERKDREKRLFLPEAADTNVHIL